MPPVATLQPLNYAANIFAAYALNEPGAACNVDRSGNGRDFSLAKGDMLASELANVMDLVPGKGAVIPADGVLYATAPNQATQHDQAWQLEGAFTLAFRFWNCRPTGLANVAPFCIYPTLPSSVQLIIYVNGAGKLCSYSENNKVGQGFESTVDVPPNRWTFLTYRRAVSGVVTLGVGLGDEPADQTYQTSGALLPPLNPPGAPGFTAFFGRYPIDPAPGGGAIADMVIWTGKRLTDAELEPQYAAAMIGA